MTGPRQPGQDGDQEREPQRRERARARRQQEAYERARARRQQEAYERVRALERQQQQREASELTDEQWQQIQPWVPELDPVDRYGNPPYNERDIVNAFRYLHCDECPWNERNELPNDFPPRHLVDKYIREWTRAGPNRSYLEHIEPGGFLNLVLVGLPDRDRGLQPDSLNDCLLNEEAIIEQAIIEGSAILDRLESGAEHTTPQPGETSIVAWPATITPQQQVKSDFEERYGRHRRVEKQRRRERDEQQRNGQQRSEYDQGYDR